jgi:hypothetical protein
MTDRKIYSNYIVESLDDRTHSTYARVTLKNAGGTIVVDPVGLPVMSDSAGAFKLYDNGDDISAVTASTLPDGSPVAILVGSARGAGVHDDLTVTAAGVEVTVMFRDGHAVFDNIDFGLLTTSGVIATGLTAANAGEQTAFKLQLEKQRVKNVEKAVAADPKLV